MFNEKYDKFRKTVADFDIIPRESKKIILGMSGGKDGGVMAHFLLEYQRRERPDIEIEMWTAPIPHWEQCPEELLDGPLEEKEKELLTRQKAVIDSFYGYWTKLFKSKTIPVQPELYKDRILNMNWPCILCYSTKTKAFHKFLAEQSYEDNTLFAFGWTKWDAQYTLLSHLMKSTGLKWHEEKKRNPQKYKTDCVFLASFSAYPKVDLGIPNKKIFRINPMIEITDSETAALAKEIGFPIIKDICKDMHGNKFDQDRRYLSTYIKIFSANQQMLKAPENAYMYSYRTFVKFLKDKEIVPPVEELDGVMYGAYDSNFDGLYEMLKY